MTNHAKCCVPVDDVLLEGGRTGFLLAHRLGGAPSDFGYVAEGLAAAGHTVSCPVLYGHGGSRVLLSATTWRHWYSSVEQAHSELSQRCDTVVVGGLGVGALLALHLAASRPQAVSAVVLLAPTFWPDGWAQPWYAAMLRLVSSKRIANMIRVDERPPYGIKDDVLRRELIEARRSDIRPRADIVGRTGGALLEVKWLARKVERELGQVVQPSLLFHPRHDDRSHLRASQLLQQKLGGIVDLVVLEDSYHLVTLDRQRELVLERIKEFAGVLPLLVKSPKPGKSRDHSPAPEPTT